jgi:hypothetical protein
MKSYRVLIYCICFLSILSVTTSHAASLTGIMSIDPGLRADGVYAGGSYFAMGANDPNGNAAMLVPTSAPNPGGIVLGTYQNFVLDPDVPHPDNWDGKGGKPGTGYSGAPTAPANIVKPFSFFGTATYVGTNPISYQSANSRPAPTADVNMGSCVGNTCSLSVELSSWEVMWNGSAFEQGPRPSNTGAFVLAAGTYDLATHAYALGWASQIKGGPFNGVIGYWHLEGTVVPVPAAIWLLASGLLGLFGLARKKRLG